MSNSPSAAPARPAPIDWYRTAVDKETLRSLSTPSDWRGFAQTIPFLLLLTATGAGACYAWYHLPWPVTVAACYIHATCYAFLGFAGAAHELSHGTVFKTKFWNELFVRLVCFLSWGNFVKFRATHMKHHAYTVHSDQDYEVVLPQALRARDWFWNFGFNLPGLRDTLKVTFRHARGVLEGELELRNFPEREAGRRKQLAQWARVLLAGHALLAAMLIYFRQWPLLFIVTLAPFYGSGLNLLCWFPQHAGLCPDVPDFRLSCRTVLLNPFVRFLYWSMNYHLEHHMYAGVPGYRLAELRRAIEADVPPADRGLWGAWRGILAILKRQRAEPGYVFVPALPQAVTKAASRGSALHPERPGRPIDA